MSHREYELDASVGSCYSGKCLLAEMGYMFGDLILTWEVGQVCRSSANPQLNFRCQCIFCTFCGMGVGPVKPAAELKCV